MGQERIALSLIALVYDAATDARLWNRFLEETSDALGGRTTTLVVFDETYTNRNVTCAIRTDPSNQRKYENYYSGLDSWFNNGKYLLTTGSVVTGQMLCPDDLLEQSEFYNDFLKPMDDFHEICGVISNERRIISMLTCMRPRRGGPFENEEIQLLKLLIPHLQRAVQIRSQLEGAESRALTAQDALDQLNIGMIQVDAKGYVMTMNRAAENIVAQRDGLSAGRIGLSLSDSNEHQKLRQMIRDASSTSQGCAFGAGGAMPVSRPSLKRPLSILVSPVVSSEHSLTRLNCTAIVFVTDPEAAVESDVEVIQRVYDLTVRESHIASLLVQGRDLNDACDELSIRRTTARA